MRANRAFRLIVSRGGLEPAFFADRNRTDRVELVSIDDGEVALFWDLPAKEAGRLAKALRTDLATLAVEEFLERWEGADGDGRLPGEH